MAARPLFELEKKDLSLQVGVLLILLSCARPSPRVVVLLIMLSVKVFCLIYCCHNLHLLRSTDKTEPPALTPITPTGDDETENCPKQYLLTIPA